MPRGMGGGGGGGRGGNTGTPGGVGDPNSQSAANIQNFLQGADYPMSQQDLIGLAQQHGAGQGVIEAIRQMPEQEFNSPIDVSRAYSEARGSDGGGGGRDVQSPGDVLLPLEIPAMHLGGFYVPSIDIPPVDLSVTMTDIYFAPDATDVGGMCDGCF